MAEAITIDYIRLYIQEIVDGSVEPEPPTTTPAA